jgi:hypothetical protein
MKISGKNPKMFIGDKGVGKVKPWTLLGYPVEEVDMPTESITFNGIFDPIEVDEVGRYFKALQIKGQDIITVNIYNHDDEYREARVRIKYEDGMITLETIDDDIIEWVKGWMI